MIFAGRSARILGGMSANLSRLALATLLLGIWAFSFGTGDHIRSFFYFFVSGCIGFGFGDIALFYALERIGPRLTVVLAQCLAVPVAALTERFWIGTILKSSQWIWIVVILIGVALALAPDRRRLKINQRMFWIGVGAGIVAALGQGWGAVISRKGSLLAAANGLPVDGGTVAFHRMLGGIIVTLIFFFLLRRSPRFAPVTAPTPDRWRRAWLWVVLNAICGPTIGVACYQWALATTPSGVVQAIVSVTPILTIPLAYFFEGDRPSLRSVIGGVIAVAGTIGLTV